MLELNVGTEMDEATQKEAKMLHKKIGLVHKMQQMEITAGRCDFQLWRRVSSDIAAFLKNAGQDVAPIGTVPEEFANLDPEPDPAPSASTKKK